MANELWRKSAHELAALIRGKQVSSREVVTSHLERIDAVNPRVNAITVTLAESALLQQTEPIRQRLVSRRVRFTGCLLLSKKTLIVPVQRRLTVCPCLPMPCRAPMRRWWRE